MPDFSTEKGTSLPTTDAARQLANLKAAKLASANSTQLATVANHIAICVDTSVSMGSAMDDRTYYPKPDETRLAIARSAIRGMVAASDPKTTAYSLVTFDSYAQLVVEKTTAYMSLQTAAYEPRGSTNMNDGILKAIDQNPTRIILLSDGEPNGFPYEGLSLAKQRRVTIDTIAIGGAKDEILRQIATETGGTFKRCNTVEDLQNHFLQLEPTAYLQLEHK